jgi:hypothetical protein
MHDAFAALLRQPTARRYKQLRSQLLAAGLPSDFSLRLAEVERLTAEQECVEATALAGELLSTGLLSLTYDAVSAAILATGNGTRRRPLLITYGSDAAELLTARGFEVLSQSLIEENARRYDVLLCSGEREFWFDVTDLLPLAAIAAARDRRPKAGASVKPNRRRLVSRR